MPQRTMEKWGSGWQGNWGQGEYVFVKMEELSASLYVYGSNPMESEKLMNLEKRGKYSALALQWGKGMQSGAQEKGFTSDGHRDTSSINRLEGRARECRF